MKPKLVYLATSYSLHPYGIEDANRIASEEAARLLKAGVPVFSPIALTHAYAMHGDINPFDHSLWLPFDRPFMNACDVLVMLKMPNWENSFGMKHELEYFTARGRPVVYMTPGEVPGEFLPGGRFATEINP